MIFHIEHNNSIRKYVVNKKVGTMQLAYFLQTNFPASFDNFATMANRFRNRSTEHRHRENKIKTFMKKKFK